MVGFAYDDGKILVEQIYHFAANSIKRGLIAHF